MASPYLVDDAREAVFSAFTFAAPHPHPGRAATGVNRIRPGPPPSYVSIEPANAGVSPRSHRIASAASISPIAPATGPTIPASRQLAISASSGGSSNKHRRQAERPGITVIACPVSPSTPPYTNGRRAATHVSLMRNLVKGLSVASSTKPINDDKDEGFSTLALSSGIHRS